MAHHQFNERQKHMILAKELSDSVIGIRLGMSAREVKRQRERLLSADALAAPKCAAQNGQSEAA